MKLNFKSKEVQSTAVAGAGILAGLTLPKMAVTFVSDVVADVKPNTNLTADQVKKINQTKLFANGALVIAGGVVGLFLEGKGDMVQFVKSFALTTAGVGALGIGKHFLQPSVEKMQAGPLKNALASGLGCPCEEEKPSYPALNFPTPSQFFGLPLPDTQIPQYGLESLQNSGLNPLG